MASVRALTDSAVLPLVSVSFACLTRALSCFLVGFSTGATGVFSSAPRALSSALSAWSTSSCVAFSSLKMARALARAFSSASRSLGVVTGLEVAGSNLGINLFDRGSEIILRHRIEDGRTVELELCHAAVGINVASAGVNHLDGHVATARGAKAHLFPVATVGEHAAVVVEGERTIDAAVPIS